MSTGAFETQARRARYQALGNACLQEGITSLLLAHHADDQAETVLGRLVAGHGRDGLVGLRPTGDIPENFGVYGVHKTGQPRRSLPPILRFDHERRLGRGPTSMLDIEGGGVRVYRPLLGFHKNRLMATCVQSGTSWIEDRTNHDPTLTVRNTLRVLLRDNRLPSALRTPSLLALTRRILLQKTDLEAQTTALIKRCDVEFDTRVGGWLIRLPKRIPILDGDSPLPATAVAEKLVQRLAESIAPCEAVNRSQVLSVAKHLFPAEIHTRGPPYLSSIPSSSSSRPAMDRPGIIARQVLFKRIVAPCKDATLNDDELDPEYIWTIIRQPCSKARHAPQSHIIFPPVRISGLGPTIAGLSTSITTTENAIINRNNSNDQKDGWSPWQIWDHRFWIRVRNQSTRPVVLRFFSTKLDLPILHRRIQHRHHDDEYDYHRQLRFLSKRFASVNVRLTLPVLSHIGHDIGGGGSDANASASASTSAWEGNGDDHHHHHHHTGPFLALPSFHGPFGGKKDGPCEGRVEWEIRYRSVDLVKDV